MCSGQIKFTFVYLNLSKIIFRNSKSEKTRANILRLAASYLRISQRKFKQWTKNWQYSQFLDFINSNVPLKIMIFSEQILFWSKFQRNNIETKRFWFMKTSNYMTRAELQRIVNMDRLLNIFVFENLMNNLFFENRPNTECEYYYLDSTIRIPNTEN